MSTDCSPNSESLHQAEIESHLAQMHEDYKLTGQEEFKSSPILKKKNLSNNRAQEEKIIKEINDQFDIGHLEEIKEQRQDVFDPYGSINWISTKKGGFDTGQNLVSFKECSQKELKEKKQQDRGVALISNSFAISDAMQNPKYSSHQ